MGIHDWEFFGEEIRKTVQEAIDKQNYEKLSQVISSKINQAVDSVSNGMKGAGVKYSNVKSQAKSNAPVFQTKIPSKAGSIVAITLGYGIGLASLLLFLLFLLAGNIVVSGLAAGFHVGAGFFGLLTAGCSMVGAWGTKKLFRINRFKTYVKTLGRKEYCNISEFAGSVGKSDKFVVKDLEYMMKNRWFVQGHLDKQKTCLMVTDKMYQQYLQLEERKRLEQQEDEKNRLLQKERDAKRAETMRALKPEIQTVIEKGEAYLQKIRACNDAIPGEEISEKISRIELLVDKIFDKVEENPKSVSDIRKLMEYYLPTTVKLLEAYIQMDAQPVGGENIDAAKREIETTLDTLNVAFEKLLDDLFQETAWDVSSDISVLNTMLAQDGLKEDGLKSKR